MNYQVHQSTVAAAVLLINCVLSAFGETAQRTSPKLSKNQAGFYRLMVGDFEVTALSDGTVPLPALEVLTNTQPHRIERLLADAYVHPQVDTSVNAFLIRAGRRLILVDAGAGKLYGPTLNKLAGSLRASGYGPEQITDILVTHIHTDHTGGLMDGDRMTYSNAILHVERRELEYWLSPDNANRASESNKRYFQEAIARVQPYVAAGKVKPFDGETELFPGVRSNSTPGHTPGHTSYSLESRGDKLMFWGDILHVAEVQFAEPAVTIQYDVDPKAAAIQREKAFADAAKQGYMVAPAHVSFPGIGRLRGNGESYRWLPIPYVNDAFDKTSAPQPASHNSKKH